MPSVTHLTTAMASNAGSNFIAAAAGFSGTNISGTLASNGIQLSVAAPGAGGGAALQGSGTFTQNTGTIQFANSNGITFGLTAGSMTASYNSTQFQPVGAYLTTAMASNRGSDFMGTNTALTANGVSMTANSSGLSLNFPAFLTTAQPVGAYLTTAALSQDSSKYAGINGAITGGSMTVNTSGVSINLPAYLTTAQPVGAYLTTARASNDAIGLNTALTANGVSVTANSSGLSLNFPAFLTTAMGSANSSLFAATGFTTTSTAGAVIAGTHDTNGLKLAVPAYLTTAQAPGAYLTTAMQTGSQSQLWVMGNSSGTIGGTNISGTVYSNGMSLSVAAPGAGGGVAISASNSAFTSGTISFNNSGALTIGTGAQAINFSVPATSSIVGVGAITISTSGSTISISGASVAASPIGISAGTVSSTYGTVTFSNANGISFGLGTGASAGNITASYNSTQFQTAGAYLTTARASNDAIGLNTAKTNATLTINSSGFSFDGGAYLTSQSVQPVAISGSNGSFAFSTATFGSSNNLHFYTTNGSIVASYADPDAWSILGNTAGASNTLALSNGTFYLAGGNNITLSQNGSTLTISGANAGGAGTLGGWEPFAPIGGGVAFSTFGLGSIYFQKLVPLNNISFNNIERRMSGSTVSSAISAQAAHTYSYGMYSLMTGASSTQYSLMGSSQIFMEASYSSNLSAGYTISQGAGSFTASSAGTVRQGDLTGFKHFYMPFTNTMTAGGNYAFAMNMSSATTGATGPLRIGLQELSVFNNLTIGKIYASTVLSTNASFVGDLAQGVYSVTSGGLPNTLALSGLTNAVSQQRMYLQFDV